MGDHKVGLAAGDPGIHLQGGGLLLGPKSHTRNGCGPRFSRCSACRAERICPPQPIFAGKTPVLLLGVGWARACSGIPPISQSGEDARVAWCPPPCPPPPEPLQTVNTAPLPPTLHFTT